MNNGSLLRTSLPVLVLVAVQVQALSTTYVAAQATYHSNYDSHNSAGGIGRTVTASAYATGDPGCYGEALAIASLPGAVKAYSGGLGAYFGPINASASGSQTIDWVAGSTTLPAGTPVSVSLAISFTGTLEATWGESASASAFLSLGQTPLYAAAASGGYDPVTASGSWAGDFTEIPAVENPDYSWRSWYRHVFLLNTVDTVHFNAVVGDVFTLTLSLNTDITSGGYESGAWADFSHSGSYTVLGVNDPTTGAPLDVQLQIVPEASAGTLLGLGLLVFSLFRGSRSSFRRSPE